MDLVFIFLKFFGLGKITWSRSRRFWSRLHHWYNIFKMLVDSKKNLVEKLIKKAIALQSLKIALKFTHTYVLFQIISSL